MSNVFMITLQAGAAPPVLKRLPAPDLEHLSVFSSRACEDGRERYRLHVGYFDDEATALALLGRVHAWYPQAWVVAAGRHTVTARLPPLPALAPARPAEALSHSPGDDAPLGDPAPHAGAAEPAPMLQSQPPLLLEIALPALPPPPCSSALPEATLQPYNGDAPSPRSPLSVSEWIAPASAPKPTRKARLGWLKRLTA